MGTREIIDTLIQGYQHKDPRLFDILRLLSTKIDFANQSLADYINSLAAEDVVAIFTLDPPDNFAFSLPGNYLSLTWDAVTDATQYEIRKGTDWDTASFILRTGSVAATLDPILTGSHTYLIKSINVSGEYSSDWTELALVIPGVSDTVVTYNVIDNNVLLYWTEPTTKPYNIAYYEFYKNSVLLGTKPGTFTTIFETAAGTFTYGIKAYDLAGNSSNLSTVSVTVSAPADFELIALMTSSLAGTVVNGIKEGVKILYTTVVETWEDHFIDNSWTSPQDQIDAGYPIYILPSETTATYEETFDFSVTFTNIIINVLSTYESITDSDVVTTCQIKFSDDDITYSAYEPGFSIFASSLRYVKVKLTFTPDTRSALTYLIGLQCTLDIRYGVDSGSVEADSTDVLGTPVLFDKSFKDVNSITVSCADTVPIYVVYDFTDVPNPTGFYVYAFDAAGARITKTVSWKARGIV